MCLKHVLPSCFLEICKQLDQEHTYPRNVTTNVRLQNLKLEIYVFSMGRENFTKRELDVINFVLGTELYKAPAMFGTYYYKPDKKKNKEKIREK
ncbi:hypothetical protein HID58_050376 [Brassica napus]|uniref:Uncharacterized protein n=1 Tax=Brassica napus TaxID=3708 RepID=A0ABQ8A6M9_BRANA|nr:hypothetical protein HID58_050376 [Brassica napus]